MEKEERSRRKLWLELAGKGFYFGHAYKDTSFTFVDLAGGILGKKGRRMWKSHPSKLNSYWPLISFKEYSKSASMPRPLEESVVTLTAHPTA